MAYYDRFGWRPYVPVAQRLASGRREVARKVGKGREPDPVVLEGRTIARTFWGKAWCDHLEGSSDYANRLPRGRAYVRNGSVVDLQLAPGLISAYVAGSTLYEVEVRITQVAAHRWELVKGACLGKVHSMLELLQGKLSDGVMEVLTHPKEGLFPTPSEIQLRCSCPDWASMCKHVAAVLYGVGARLDLRPELLFLLRGVKGEDLVAEAARGALEQGSGIEEPSGASLSELFGIDIDDAPAPRSTPRTPLPGEGALLLEAQAPAGSRGRRTGRPERPQEGKPGFKSRLRLLRKYFLAHDTISLAQYRLLTGLGPAAAKAEVDSLLEGWYLIRKSAKTLVAGVKLF